jgi:hypothetical protein
MQESSLQVVMRIRNRLGWKRQIHRLLNDQFAVHITLFMNPLDDGDDVFRGYAQDVECINQIF